ncbi:hypothetical protein [Leptospira kanakyensis]|nr:hypothetical protein [Leptospira kanakyensis]
MILVIFTQNCLNHKSSLLDQHFKIKDTHYRNINLFIRKIEISKVDDDLKSLQEETIKSNIKILLEQSNLFKSVNYYSNFLNDENAIIVDLDFYQYDNHLRIDPLYFPLSFLTLTLYIWFGGNIVNFESKIKLEINSYDKNNKLLASKIFREENIINDNIYNPWKSRRIIPEIKSNFILKSVIEVTN